MGNFRWRFPVFDEESDPRRLTSVVCDLGQLPTQRWRASTVPFRMSRPPPRQSRPWMRNLLGCEVRTSRSLSRDGGHPKILRLTSGQATGRQTYNVRGFIQTVIRIRLSMPGAQKKIQLAWSLEREPWFEYTLGSQTFWYELSLPVIQRRIPAGLAQPPGLAAGFAAGLAAGVAAAGAAPAAGAAAPSSAPSSLAFFFFFVAILTTRVLGSPSGLRPAIQVSSRFMWSMRSSRVITFRERTSRPRRFKLLSIATPKSPAEINICASNPRAGRVSREKIASAKRRRILGKSRGQRN